MSELSLLQQDKRSLERLTTAYEETRQECARVVAEIERLADEATDLDVKVALDMAAHSTRKLYHDRAERMRARTVGLVNRIAHAAKAAR
jgi:hypothetical protein